MEKQEQVFRQKSLDRISSPEQLHDYMRVTSPQLWMILVVILSLLVGFVVFAATNKVESAVTVKGTVTGKTCIVQLDVSQRDLLNPGMPVRIAGQESVISSFYQDQNGFTGAIDLEKLNVPEGDYDVEIVMESSDPIHLLFGR